LLEHTRELANRKLRVIIQKQVSAAS